MILSFDVQNNLDVHNKSGMCQITHRKCFVLWQSFHFQGACICCHSFFFSSSFFLLCAYLISKVCVCIYFWLVRQDRRSENEEKSLCPSFLIAEGMIAYQDMQEILNLWFWWVISVPKWKELIKLLVFYL